LLCAAVFPGGALAAAPHSIVANLDGDARWERLQLNGSEADGYRLVLTDHCHGEQVTRVLTQRWDTFLELRVRELDGATRRREIWIGATRGTTGGDQLWKVMRLSGRGCPEPRTLFSFRSAWADEPGYDVIEAQASTADYRPAVAGKEIRVLELLWQPADGCLACASHSRRLYYQYVPSLGRYGLYYRGPIEGPPG
jgi:hypothetical protein